MHTHEVAPQRCPNCGAPADSVSSIHEVPPGPGDIGICFTCTAPHTFDAAGNFVECRPDMEISPDAAKAIDQHRQAIAQLRGYKDADEALVRAMIRRRSLN